MSLPANLPQQLLRATTAFTTWCLTAKPGHTVEHVMHPDYWVHVLNSYQIGLHDEIRVMAEDGSFFLHLLVTEIDERRMWAKMRVLHKHWDTPQPSETELPDPDGYKIEFSGPQKWRIVTPASQVAAKGFATREEAVAALANLKSAKAA